MNEDQWIKLVSKQSQRIGDDAAVLCSTPGQRIVLCSDSMVEGVHFLLKSISPENLGWKSLAVNLSDLAAMGAVPKGSLLNLSLPHQLMGEWSKKFLKGYLALSRKHAVELVGGDTTLSLKGAFVSVTVMGEVSQQNTKWRTGAKPGDLICVTGTLGNSRAGLFLQKKSWTDQAARKLLKAHHQPKPQVEMGQWLGGRSEVTAMMDVSDGLCRDVGRMCRSSQVSGEVELEKVPVSASLQKFAVRFRKDASKEALLGGEDYELLFTCKPHAIHALQLKFKEKFGTGFFVLGRMKEGRPAAEILSQGKKLKIPSAHFEHF